METIKAKVTQEVEKHFIEIAAGDVPIRIPMSEEKPNDVKTAFNKLISRIKEGEFKVELENVGDDLFSQVAKEYILQLNKDIHEVRAEMEQRGLVGRKPSKA